MSLVCPHGNLLTLPFAVSFPRDVLPQTIQDTDDVYAQAFLQHYTARLAGNSADAPRRLLTQLKNEQPRRFQKSDRSLIYLLSKLSDPSLDQELDKLVKAFDESGDFHPDIEHPQKCLSKLCSGYIIQPVFALKTAASALGFCSGPFCQDEG